jgi:SAM-dependent methyltransferase
MILRTFARKIRRRMTQRRNASRKSEQIFSEVYRRNQWGGAPGEFCSGSGSRGPQTLLYIETVRRFIADNDIKTVVDIGCGDFVIGREIAHYCEHYIGVDVVPDLIAHLSRHFGSDRVEFRCIDAARDPLPTADLCLVRQVLQHLSNRDIQAIIEKLGPYRSIIVTEHYPARSSFKAYNLDKITGPDVRAYDGSAVYLDKPPFNLAVEKLVEFPLPQQNAVRSHADPELLTTFLVSHQSPHGDKRAPQAAPFP